MNIRISAEREIQDPRLATVLAQPHRRDFADPLDPRLECSLGRLFARGKITEREYHAGCQWRSVYHQWLCSIGAPSPFPAAVDYGVVSNRQGLLDSDIPDDEAEKLAQTVKDGVRMLKAMGARVFHAVNAIAVYEESEELGDFEFTAYAAKRGLAALADFFG